ncbi:hypothetical protein DXG03_009336 [Asterophora parasitica]|uniref:Uncharacterized protein n=1 Tax=Asterophora parasitica TaxID=117018 RepID=A0A9P7G5H3_9AGAR|nr:hypothetical protein DXG03_009336 [Asterophora parasitica]
MPTSNISGAPGLVFSALIILLILATSLTVNASPTSPLTSRQTSPSICTKPPRDSCAFYADCLESQYHCGANGYPIGYGQNFCEKFGARRAELSAKGQTWMLDTMQCLQRELVPEATSTVGVTCTSLEKKAFASHAHCYVDSGLCALPPSDWAAIVAIVEFKTLFKSLDSFIATLKAGNGCLKAYLWFLAHLIF